MKYRDRDEKQMKISPLMPGVLEQLLPGRGDILEIGCGRGMLLASLASSRRYRLEGIDVDPEAVRQARAAGLQVREGQAEKLPYGKDTFDAVVMECVFSLCRPWETVSELVRVLRPGGWAAIADLYSGTENVTLSASRMVKHLYVPETMELFFRGRMRLEKYQDYTPRLRSMFFQMVMNRTVCGCVADSDLLAMKTAKVGYGVWLWKKI